MGSRQGPCQLSAVRGAFRTCLGSSLSAAGFPVSLQPGGSWYQHKGAVKEGGGPAG